MSLLPRLLAAALPLLLLAQPAAAEIVSIAFKSEKTEKKFAKLLTRVGDRNVLLGEVVSGVTFNGGVVTTDPGRCEFFIADPKDPEAIPYKMKKGERVATAKKFLVGIPGEKIEAIQIFDRNQTFAGLTREYRIRNEILEKITEQRDATEKGSEEWTRHHMRYVSRLGVLRKWLASTAYGAAAGKLDKKIAKAKKLLMKGDTTYRLKEALESVQLGEISENLVEKAKELTSGISTFQVSESTHLRITYPDDLETEAVHKALELGESIIDLFRLEHVDPYADPISFPDQIPDRVILEFFLTPLDNMRLKEQFLVEYHGMNWGKDKERALQTGYTTRRLNRPSRDMIYGMVTENMDLEGLVAHQVGHTLAEFHYNKGSGFERQAWLPEAVGYFVSFEHLGRNSMTCFQWQEPDPTRSRRGKREKGEGEEGEKTAMMGMRSAFNALALSDGPKIDALALLNLAELSNADFAKAWSFYDFIVHNYGREGEEWLRIGSKASKDPKKMIAEWREASEQIFEIEGQDVFKWIDEQWREYATNGQNTSDDGK